MTRNTIQLTYDSNPCWGCTSAACRTCICAAERNISELEALKVPVRTERAIDEKSASARKKAAAPKVKKPVPAEKPDKVKEVFGEPYEMIGVPVKLFGDMKDAFIVRADGDGMRNAGILSGDQVIFEKERVPESGDIVAGLVNGTLMCRRIFYEGETIRVRREDGETPDILTTDCVILGVMVGLARNCRKAG